MLWTLAAFLLIMSLLLLKFLKKGVARFKDTYYIYPSEAVIDQALPQEIMEHVMTFLDARAMIECRLVSKYWRYHATKPSVEAVAVREARQRYDYATVIRANSVLVRLREVFEEIQREYMYISTKDIDHVMNSELTNNMSFARASALASHHGAELIVADRSCEYILQRSKWNRADFKKKYFLLMRCNKYGEPWHFSSPVSEFTAIPMFDATSVDWYETHEWTAADILIDATKLPSFFQHDVKLYSYHPCTALTHFYFIPLNDQFLHVLMFLFSPMIVHDALQSSYLPTIKSWFGPIAFIASVILHFLYLWSCHRRIRPARLFSISLTVFFTSYFLLTYISYPVSMSVFAGMAIQALMLFYTLVGNNYFSYYGQRMSKKKWQLFITGILLIFLMIDWKLVVDAVRDLSIFRTLFENTFCYCVILLHFILNNVMTLTIRETFKWRHLFNWSESLVKTLLKCYCYVILMILVAPTWRGNHL